MVQFFWPTLYINNNNNNNNNNNYRHRSNLLFFDVQSAGNDVILISDRHGENSGSAAGIRRQTDGVNGKSGTTYDCVGWCHQLHQHEVAARVADPGAPAVWSDAVRDATLNHRTVTDASHLVTYDTDHTSSLRYLHHKRKPLAISA